MDRKKMFLAYELAAVIPLVAVSAISLLTGEIVLATLPGLLGTIVLMLACLLWVHFSMKRRIDDQHTRLMNIYDYDCDPKEFVKGGGQIAFNALQAHENGDLLEEGDAWFLGPYGLACIDTGDMDNAEKIATAILEDALQQKKFAAQASMLASLEPLALRLRGPQDALGIVEKANEAASFDESGSSEQVKTYLQNEGALLTALIDQDTDTLTKRYEQIMRSQHQPTRLRVLAADALAGIYRALDRESDEIDALNFVESYGGKLPVVAIASERLEELMSA